MARRGGARSSYRNFQSDDNDLGLTAAEVNRAQPELFPAMDKFVVPFPNISLPMVSLELEMMDRMDLKYKPKVSLTERIKEGHFGVVFAEELKEGWVDDQAEMGEIFAPAKKDQTFRRPNLQRRPSFDETMRQQNFDEEVEDEAEKRRAGVDDDEDMLVDDAIDEEEDMPGGEDYATNYDNDSASDGGGEDEETY